MNIIVGSNLLLLVNCKIILSLPFFSLNAPCCVEFNIAFTKVGGKIGICIGIYVS